MSWWSQKTDPPKPPNSNVVPFRRADRPEVLERLRENANRKFRPVDISGKVTTAELRKTSPWNFEEMPWESIDEVLWHARRDLHRGLVKGDSVLIAIYDEDEDRIVWYQLGMSDTEVAAAFDEWRNEQ